MIPSAIASRRRLVVYIGLAVLLVLMCPVTLAARAWLRLYAWVGVHSARLGCELCECGGTVPGCMSCGYEQEAVRKYEAAKE